MVQLQPQQVDVQLEIEASESFTGVTVYYLLIYHRIAKHVPFKREVSLCTLFKILFKFVGKI